MAIFVLGRRQVMFCKVRIVEDTPPGSNGVEILDPQSLSVEQKIGEPWLLVKSWKQVRSVGRNLTGCVMHAALVD